MCCIYSLKSDAANRDVRMALIGMYREQGNSNMARLHLNQLRSLYPDDTAVEGPWREMNP